MPDEKTTKKTARKTTKSQAEEKAPVVEETNDAGTTAPTETSAEPTSEAGSDSEVVEVSKADLAAFMGRLNDLEETNRKLLEAADKGRMFAITEKERQEKNELPRVKLTRIGGPRGKLVVAWQMGKNESYVDGNRLIEHQTMNVFYQDGSTEEMPLIDFYRQQNKDTVAEIRSRTKEMDDSGEEVETLKVVTKDGKEEITIGLKFVN